MDNLISRFSRLVAEGHEERDLIEGPGVHHVGQTRLPPPGEFMTSLVPHFRACIFQMS